MEVSQFDWLIIGVAVTELIVVIKLVYGLNVKSKLHEAEVVNLKEHNKMQAEQFEELKSSLDSHFLKMESYFEKSNASREALRKDLFKEMSHIEDKFESVDKSTQTRVGNMAQAIVRLETKLEK